MTREQRIEEAGRELASIVTLFIRVHGFGDCLFKDKAARMVDQIVLDSAKPWQGFPEGEETTIRAKAREIELTSRALPVWRVNVFQKRHRETNVATIELFAPGKQRYDQIDQIAELFGPSMVRDKFAGRAFLAALSRSGGHWERRLVARLDQWLHQAGAAEPAEAAVQPALELAPPSPPGGNGAAPEDQLTPPQNYVVALVDQGGEVLARTTGPIAGIKPAKGEYRSARRAFAREGYAEEVAGVGLFELDDCYQVRTLVEGCGILEEGHRDAEC